MFLFHFLICNIKSVHFGYVVEEVLDECVNCIWIGFGDAESDITELITTILLTGEANKLGKSFHGFASADILIALITMKLRLMPSGIKLSFLISSLILYCILIFVNILFYLFTVSLLRITYKLP